MENRNYDVIIVGGGPGGLSTGIYLGRSDVKTLIIEKENFGSLLLAHKIDNYPGFPNGITGVDLQNQMKEQCKKYNVDFDYSTLLDLDLSGDKKILKTSSGNFSCNYIVIASGTSISQDKIKGEKEFSGKGVSYCATCDGAFTRGLNTCLFGQGDEVAEEALFLTKYAKSVSIFVPNDNLICNDNTRSNLDSNNVKIVLNAELSEITGSEYVEKVIVKVNSENKEFMCDYVFLYLGTKSNTELYGAYFKIDQKGYIVTDDLMKTSVEHVYAVGDIRSKTVRQVTTAVNDGTIAALDIIKEQLNNKKN